MTKKTSYSSGLRGKNKNEDKRGRGKRDREDEKRRQVNFDPCKTMEQKDLQLPSSYHDALYYKYYEVKPVPTLGCLNELLHIFIMGLKIKIRTKD